MADGVIRAADQEPLPERIEAAVNKLLAMQAAKAEPSEAMRHDRSVIPGARSVTGNWGKVWPIVLASVFTLCTTAGWGYTAWTLSRSATLQDKEVDGRQREKEATQVLLTTMKDAILKNQNDITNTGANVGRVEGAVTELRGRVDNGQQQRIANDLAQTRLQATSETKIDALTTSVSDLKTQMDRVLRKLDEVRRDSRPLAQDQRWPNLPLPPDLRARIEPLSPIVRRMALAEVGYQEK